MSGEATMKKVLIVAQHFPPAGGVGSIRVAKFVKYLREFGWEPVVLTVRQDCYPDGVWLDQSLMKDIPEDIAIYRTGIWCIGAINDQGIRWLPYLLSAIGKVIMKEKPQLVYLTGGPFFPLVAGPFVKFLFRRPYVVDLRDPWRLARPALPTRGLKVQLGKLLKNICEPLVIRHAARVVCATPKMQEEYQLAYPAQSEKFVTITNGFDPESFTGLVPRKYDEFTIVYTGKFRSFEALHDPKSLFEALHILRQRGMKVKFLHVGAIEEEIVKLARVIGIGDAVDFVGPKTHAEALSYALGASLLVVIESERKMGLPVKLFDYMGCKKPVLALCSDDDEICTVAGEMPNVILCDNEKPEAIAEAIEKVYHGQVALDEPDSESLTRYHRRVLTEQLASVFNDVLQALPVDPMRRDHGGCMKAF